MKTRYVVQIACNDKVFDASENVFDKVLDERVCSVQRYIHIFTSIKEARLCQRFGRWHSLLMCPRVERFESRIKQVVERVCRRCPMLCSPQLYVSFEVILQTLPVIHELLSALVYESL